MADEIFLTKLSAQAFLVIVYFHIIFFLATSSAKDETLAKEPGSTGQCDIFSGEWIPDPATPPPYDASCSFIPDYQNCLQNGRPDTDYLHWRWKPFGCDLPRFDAIKFLNAMRDKSIVFIGESVIHNQMSSLVCLLSQVEEVTLVYHDKRWQSHTWYIPAHNITLGLIWSPFLLASTQNVSYIDMHISLDALDNVWTDEYPKYDYVLFTGGQWFLKETIMVENNAVIGCHNCPGKDLRELGSELSFRRALRLAFEFMGTSSDHKPPLIIYRSWVPDHFEGGGGALISGGYCNRTQPFKEGDQYNIKSVDAIMRSVEREEVERGLRSGLRLKPLDVYHLSLLRSDAHQGAYRNFHPDCSKNTQNDCLHWCLPGLPETWNDMLMNIILVNEEILRSES